MKTVLVLATVVAMLHAKSYKMETRSSGSLIARLIKDNLYHKYLENHRFHRTQVHKKGSQPIMDHHDYFYLANITFGTPGQTVSLMMDTSSSNLWVIDAACNTDACNGRFNVPYTRHKFDSTKSSTFSTTNNTIFLQQQYGSCTGILVNDTVSFADLTIDQQEFADIADMDGYLPSRPFDGVFGLGWPAVASGEVSPPMQNILPNLDAPLFTIWMDRKAALNATESPGLITYGAIDTTNCQSDLNYVPLSSEVYWQFNIEGFSVGSFSESGHGVVSADTSMSLIGAPGYIVDAVVSQTGAQFDIMYGFYKVDCSTMKTQPDLVFSINGFKYNIPPEEYLFDYGIEEGKVRALALAQKFLY
ncbi:unnamed protein product [Angiostrongylus costaricensis]|uniref:Peptidase A1 domain-containing protein n=1 Tax=Angiostrongylus costaricensis TaxID=334426 RepID=A0A0R3PZQ3_ANGCS|nr:unnamed protein product [Angiostrongylus costaricensis]